MRNCRYAGIKIEEEPQGVICGNTIYVPSGVDRDDVSVQDVRYSVTNAPAFLTPRKHA